MTGLKQYERRTESQFGEDGVIEEIFCRIGTKNKICVDIGAWDGKHLSNTYHLGLFGWTRVLYEKDESKSAIHFVNDVAIIREVRNIDQELEPMEIPEDFDFLNIDIDGDDYWLWADSVKYKPRVVCIEYNQTVAPGISVIQERGGSFGASSKAFLDLAEKKGYVFVHATVTNMIFVRSGYKMFFPATSGIPTDWVVWGGIGYNGKRYQFGKQAHNDDQDGRHESLICEKKIVCV